MSEPDYAEAIAAALDLAIDLRLSREPMQLLAGTALRDLADKLAASQAKIATLRQALTQIHMDVTQTTRDALAAVQAPAAPQEP